MSDANLADNVRAVLKLIYPDEITPQGMPKLLAWTRNNGQPGLFGGAT